MKFFNRPIYFCSNCKTIVEQIEQLFFVEESSPRAFCSEKCIEEFYFPFIDTFEAQKNLIREELGLVETVLEEYLSHPDLIDGLFSTPDEIWSFDNLFKEEIFIFIKKVQVESKTITLVSMCLVFNFRPSFVLAVDVTEKDKIVDLYLMGNKIEDLEPYYKAAQQTEGEILKVSGEELEQRKASLLASMLENRSDNDIELEKFNLYEVYQFPTIEQPDLVTEWADDSSQSFHICSKAFELEGNSFYYIVVCLPYLTEDGKFIPILGFPTIDGTLYGSFTNGKRLSGIIKN